MLQANHFGKTSLFQLFGNRFKQIIDVIFVALNFGISRDSERHDVEHFHIGEEQVHVVRDHFHQRQKSKFTFDRCLGPNLNPLRKNLWHLDPCK